MLRIAFLTYLESVNGVYLSQVADTCNFLESLGAAKITTVGVFSPRDYLKQRDKLFSARSNSKAICAPLGWRSFGTSQFFARLAVHRFFQRDISAVICRGPFAAHMGMRLRESGAINAVAYDGRGAVAEEWNEHDIAPNRFLRYHAAIMEEHSVLNSDYRIAVSQKLVKYWRDTYSYVDNRHCVIPCTIDTEQINRIPSSIERARRRERMGIPRNHIVLCYSGSTAGWQSLRSLDRWLSNLMSIHLNVSLIILTPELVPTWNVGLIFPNRVFNMCLPPLSVRRVLEIADYGLLMRDRSVANTVAAPVKFAEYLSAGLKVIISPSIGDYSEFVSKYSLGILNDFDADAAVIEPLSCDDRLRSWEISRSFFTKSAYTHEYKQLLEALLAP